MKFCTGGRERERLVCRRGWSGVATGVSASGASDAALCVADVAPRDGVAHCASGGEERKERRGKRGGGGGGETMKGGRSFRFQQGTRQREAAARPIHWALVDPSPLSAPLAVQHGPRHVSACGTIDPDGHALQIDESYSSASRLPRIPVNSPPALTATRGHVVQCTRGETHALSFCSLSSVQRVTHARAV